MEAPHAFREFSDFLQKKSSPNFESGVTSSLTRTLPDSNLFSVSDQRLAAEQIDLKCGATSRTRMYERRRFFPRTYRLNYEIGNSLYSKHIADLNARAGTISTSLIYPHWSVRDDLYVHESIYGKRSRDLIRNDWRHTARFHDQLVSSAFPGEDFSKYWRTDGTYWRRLWPSVDSFGRTHAGETVRWVEQSRTREKHVEWERQRERERRQRLQEIYTPQRSEILYERPRRHLSVKW